MRLATGPDRAGCAAGVSRPFELSGHRGARGLWPENTLAGVAGALHLGVSAVEFDVVLSADGVPVVLHDLVLNPDLARLPGGGWIEPPGPAVRDLSAAALQTLDVGRARPGSAVARAHPKQVAADGERVPTLAALFELVALHPGVRLQVELKTDPARPALSPEPATLLHAVLRAADAAGVAGRIALRSFDWRGLQHAAVLRPEIPLCYLTPSSGARALLAVRRAAAGAAADWAPGFRGLDRERVAEAQRAGLRVKPWTVNRPADMRRLIGCGIDGFCTDRPDLARVAMAQAGLDLPPALAAP